MNLKEKLFNLEDIRTKIDEVGPYQNVFLQECEYMNYLLLEIIRYFYYFSSSPNPIKDHWKKLIKDLRVC